MSVTNWVVQNYEAESQIRRTTARYGWMTVAWFAAAALTLPPVFVGYGVLLLLGVPVGDLVFTVVWVVLTLLVYGRFDRRVEQRVERQALER